MGQLAEKFTDDLLEQVAESMEAIGAEMVADIRETISVRVVRQGSKVIRSKPGEFPRYDTGGLWHRVQMEVASDAAGRQVTLTVFVTGLVARFLEDGTSKMDPRPFWLPAWLRWVNRVTSRLLIRIH